MKLTKKLAVLGASLVALTLMGTAQAKMSFEDAYTKCGIGGAIFKKNSTLAAISNITWDLGTTAVSSGLSSEESCTGAKVAAAAFIHSSYATLEQDIAKGEGKHLSALMDIMQCDASARAEIVTTVRSGFTKAVSAKGYSSSTPFQKSEGLYNIMQSGKVSASCGA